MRDVDWPEEFRKWEISMEGIKSVCYASLAKEDLEKYDFIIYDECHRLTMPNLRKLSLYPTKPVLGLTATFPKTKYEDDKERVDLITRLLPPVHTISTDEAVDLGLIADFEVMICKFYIDGVTKNIPCGTKANELRTEKVHYAKLTKRISWAVIKKIEALKFSVISKRMNFLYNLPSKLRLAKQCMEQLNVKDKRTIVFAGSIEQANELCGNDVYHSKSDDKALQAFQRKDINLLGAVRALNEGKNLTTPDQALIVQVDSVDRNLVQRIGRIIRRRYDDMGFKARIVILVAIGTADEQWYNSAIKEFETSRIREFIVRVPDIKK
jgi:superfamily II DNA or RNA helicase